jgi:hypothetical protein
MSDLGGQWGASGGDGCTGVVSRLHVTKQALPYFFFYFPYQNNLTCHGQGDPTIGCPEDQPEDIRLDNHLHSWLARPTTLRLCQCCAPTVQMLISYIGLPATPKTTLQQSRLAGGPAHRPPYLRHYFPLVNTRPVPVLSGSLPPFLHDIMLRMGHTPLSFHSLSGATQLANPYIWGALLTEPLSHGALLQQAS